jgi:hypothetical protein
VIRHAQSFDAAVDLFQQFRAPSGWVYLLVSSKERRVGTVEISSRHVAVRESDNDYFVQTNRFLTPALSPYYLSINRSVDDDSDARCTRIEQILEQELGRMDVAGVMSILADQVDPSVNEVRGLGNTISVHTTVASVVLRPEGGRAYVATGTAPVGHSEFVEVPLVGALDTPESFPAQLQVVNNSEFTRTHPQIWRAVQLFIRAKSAYENHNDVAAAYELLQQTVRCDPSNPAYFFQLGIFALKNRHFQDACDAFDSVFSRPYVTQQLSRLARYYRGRARAHLAQTNAAISDLSTVTADKDADGPLRTAARRALRRTKLFGRCPLKQRSMMIMMQQSDMLRY